MPTDHEYTRTTIVEDLRNEEMQTQDTFMALVYEHDQENDQTRCNAVKFTYDMAKDEWNEPK